MLGLSPWIRDSTKLAYITMLRDTWRAAINKTCSVPQDYKKEVWLVRQHSTAWVTVSATWLWKEKQQSLIFFADPKQGLWHFIRVYKHSKPLPRWPWPPNSSNPITWLETQLLPKINRDKLQKWKQPSALMVIPFFQLLHVRTDMHWLHQNSHPAP